MTQLLEFKTLKELMNYFVDESVCREYMEEMRWPDGKVICPFCDWSKPYKLKDGKTYRCRNRSCRKDFTVTVKSVFENSKIKLSTWLAALYVLTGHKKGISSHQLARDLNIRQKASWFLLHRIREMFADKQNSFLSGLVEIDEVYSGGRWENMNKTKRTKMREIGKDNKIPVMGMVERGGKAKLKVIGINDFKTIIQDNVKKTAILVTDSHQGYLKLGQEYAGHESVNHSILEFKRGIYYTNTVEGFFSIFKRMVIGTYHHLSPAHLQRYCDEVTYRFNSRKVKDADRFVNTFQHINGRLTYKQLIEKKVLPFSNGESEETR